MSFVDEAYQNGIQKAEIALEKLARQINFQIVPANEMDEKIKQKLQDQRVQRAKDKMAPNTAAGAVGGGLIGASTVLGKKMPTKQKWMKGGLRGGLGALGLGGLAAASSMYNINKQKNTRPEYYMKTTVKR